MENNKKDVVASTTKKDALDRKLPSLNPEELVLSKSLDLELINKSFSDLTEEDLKVIPSFSAKVYEEEKVVGWGASKEVQKHWKFALKLAPNVVLGRRITESEKYLIDMLNPGLVSNKAKVTVPCKLITGINDRGQRYFRCIAFICESVFFGNSQKVASNNGFLSRQEITSLIINNRLAKTEKDLKPVLFSEVIKDVADNIDSSMEDNYERLVNDEF